LREKRSTFTPLKYLGRPLKLCPCHAACLLCCKIPSEFSIESLLTAAARWFMPMPHCANFHPQLAFMNFPHIRDAHHMGSCKTCLSTIRDSYYGTLCPWDTLSAQLCDQERIRDKMGREEGSFLPNY
jgi:hypothetical protein